MWHKQLFQLTRCQGEQRLNTLIGCKGTSNLVKLGRMQTCGQKLQCTTFFCQSLVPSKSPQKPKSITFHCPSRAFSSKPSSSSSTDIPSSSSQLHNNSFLGPQSLKSFGIGAVGGLLGSMVGLGGGVVMIPLLVAFSNVSQHQATGNSMVAVCATGSVGALTFGFGGELDYVASALLAGAMIFTVAPGAHFGQTLNSDRLKLALAMFMITGGLLIPIDLHLRKTQLESHPDNEEKSASETKPSELELPQPKGHSPTEKSLQDLSWGKAAFYSGVGVGTGFLSGLLGVGGGTLATPILTIFSGMTQQTVVGTMLMAMIPAAIIGVRTHYVLGNVSFLVGIPLALGACVGARLGSNSALGIPEDYLKYLCAISLFIIGGRTVAVHYLRKIK